MTCKDCLHYECCHSEIAYGMGSDDLTGKYFTDIETRCKNFINKACFVVLPCNVGDIIKDGTGESLIVDEIRYTKSFLFDGSEKETKKVSLRDKDAKPPIYSTTIHSFDEIENILKQQEAAAHGDPIPAEASGEI